LRAVNYHFDDQDYFLIVPKSTEVVLMSQTGALSVWF
jgi:hypothetical protein